MASDGKINFNPRAPCGARLLPGWGVMIMSLFQSTRPLRGATGRLAVIQDVAPCISIHAPLAGRDLLQPGDIYLISISIHAPLAGRDRNPSGPARRSRYFNPRAPCGARREDSASRAFVRRISIHAPLAGRDGRSAPRAPLRHDFNPRAPCGARQQKCTNCFAHFCDNRQVLSKFAQNAACQGILIPFPFRKSLQIWVRTARAISARLRFAL